MARASNFNATHQLFEHVLLEVHRPRCSLRCAGGVGRRTRVQTLGYALQSDVSRGPLSVKRHIMFYICSLCVLDFCDLI